jgi:hypothetical protein
MVTTLEQIDRANVQASRGYKYWKRRAAKFSQPERLFRFKAIYSNSKKPQRLMVFARALEQAVFRLAEESNVSLISYQSTDSNFKPYKSTPVQYG